MVEKSHLDDSTRLGLKSSWLKLKPSDSSPSIMVDMACNTKAYKLARNIGFKHRLDIMDEKDSLRLFKQFRVEV